MAVSCYIWGAGPARYGVAERHYAEGWKRGCDEDECIRECECTFYGVEVEHGGDMYGYTMDNQHK